MIITLWAHMGAHWEHIKRASIDENFVGTHWEHEDQRNVSGAHRSRPLPCMSRFRLEVSAEREWNSGSSYLVEREREREQRRLGPFFFFNFSIWWWCWRVISSGILHFKFASSHARILFDWIWLCMVSNFRVPFRLEVSSCCWACSSCCNKGLCHWWSHWRGGGGQCRIHRPQVLQDFYLSFLFWDSLFVCVCVCVCVGMVT